MAHADGSDRDVQQQPDAADLPLRRRLRLASTSLTSRIVVLVFMATVMTALLVTGVSVHAIQRFLGEQIDERYPAVLDSARERIEFWYSQVRSEVDTFARSTTVEKNATVLRRTRRGPQAARARDEITQYLGYVLERFEHYRALFLLDDEGEILLWVGVEQELPATLRSRLAQHPHSRVGDVVRIDAEQVQIASAPVGAGRRTRPASLHALVDLESLDRMLLDDEVGPAGELILVRSDGRLVRGTGSRAAGRTHPGPLPVPNAAPQVRDPAGSGGRVVSASVEFDRFGWLLILEKPYDAAFEPVVSVVSRVLLLNLAIVCVFGLISLRVAIRLINPIKALSDGARRVANNETGVQIPDPGGDNEIALLTRAFNRMTESLHEHQLELHRKSDALELLSVTDGLTGLHNHRYFQEQLQLEIKRADRSGLELALVLVDIDDFKRLNDTYGHAVGDEVLKGVARVMKLELRDTDVLARYGGEEFAVLSTQNDEQGALQIAEKLRQALAEERFQADTDSGPQIIGITASLGVALYRGDPRTFFNEADRALYQAKAQGKDCVILGG